MKRLLTALFCFVVSVMTAVAEEALQYSKPFQGLEAASVSSVVLRTGDKDSEIKVSDKEWTRTLLATITDQDFPLRKEPMSFALPEELCSVEFRDGSGKALRAVAVFGAWNLLSIKSEGTSVLGSNRRFAEVVIRKLEESRPEYIQNQRKTYRDQFSGKYEKEYRDILKSEQSAPVGLPGAEDPAFHGTLDAAPGSR